MFVILNISDSDKHFKSAQDEYLKRLWKQLVIDTIKPTKHWIKSQIIQKETETIIAKIQKKYTDYNKFILSIDGQIINTEQFVDLLSKNNYSEWQSGTYGKILFCIWWPYGMDENLLKQTFPKIKKISFWKMTMPHWLAKLVLLEQIYRVNCIESGKKYHY